MRCLASHIRHIILCGAAEDGVHGGEDLRGVLPALGVDAADVGLTGRR
ncbi:MAG: hypothetical protein KY475_23715 [Planctomycetes bacterium]|nr:hypothetical protein [Planctomycetota bacterium]